MKVETAAKIVIRVHVVGSRASGEVRVEAVRIGGLDITGAIPTDALAICDAALRALEEEPA